MINQQCQVCGAQSDAYLCKPCTHELELAIGDMTSLIHEISNLATGQTRVYRSGRPSTDQREIEQWDAEQRQVPAHLRSRESQSSLPATRLMVNLAARELLYDAYDTLLAWASRLDADEISSKHVVAYLLSHVNAARHSEDAGQIHDEITYLHRQLEHAVDRSPSRLYAGPCHAETAEPDVSITIAGETFPIVARGRCERDLYAKPGSDVIRCDGHRGDQTGCGHEHTWAEREAWLLDSIEDALLPLHTWQQALPKMLPELKWPPRQTWWRWAEHDGRYQRLFSQTQDRVGTPLYRGGDILDVVRRVQDQLATRGGRRSA